MRVTQRVLLAAGIITGAACGGGGEAPGDHAPTAPIAVQVTAAEQQTIAEGVEVGGVVHAVESATVASRVMAPIVAVRVSPGDRVRRGQIVVELDNEHAAANARRADAAVTAAERAGDAARAEREAAQAALTLAVATHDRIAALHQRKSATSQELDEALAARHTAESRAAGAAARVEEATAALASAQAAATAAATSADYARITAPFDGTVTEKLVEPGNLATPGAPLLRIDRAGGLRVDVQVDETRATALSPGTTIVVILPPGDAPGPDGPRVVQATVAEIARAIDVDARAVLVKLTLPPVEGLRSGAFVRVRLPGTPRTALTVPADAVRRDGQLTSVFVVDGDVARLRLVRVGRRMGDAVPVEAGIDAGERVVVDPPLVLIDGSPVRVEGSGGRP